MGTLSDLKPVGYNLDLDPDRWSMLFSRPWAIVYQWYQAERNHWCRVEGDYPVHPPAQGVLINLSPTDRLDTRFNWFVEAYENFSRVEGLLTGTGKARYSASGYKPARGEVVFKDFRDIEVDWRGLIMFYILNDIRWYVWGFSGDNIGGSRSSPTYQGYELTGPDLTLSTSGEGNTENQVRQDQTLPATGCVVEQACINEGAIHMTAYIRAAPKPFFLVMVESATCVDQKHSIRIHVISDVPEMPDIRVKSPIVGLTESESEAVQRHYTFTVEYAKGNRSDSVVFESTVAASEWQVPWGDKFCGGKISCVIDATLPDGTVLKGTVDPSQTHWLWGTNPSKGTIRASFDSIEQLVSIYRESRFTQFSKSTSAKSLSEFQIDPLPVLRAGDNGFGIGQLTNSPLPSISELWKWTENAASAKARLETARIQARKHVENTKATDPAAPSLTEDQLDLDMWKLYNSGKYYHTYNKSTHRWVPHPNAYADDCANMRTSVASGFLPPGWD